MTGGVAFLVSEKYENHIREIEKIGNRHLIININDNITIVNTYAPDNSFAITARQKYWKKLMK